MTPKIKEPPAHYHGSIIEWKALSREARYRVQNKYTNKRRAYYAANKDALKAKTSVYREANKDKIRAYASAYREANKDKSKISDAAYYELNRDTMLEKHRNYRIKKNEEFYEMFGTYEIQPGVY